MIKRSYIYFVLFSFSFAISSFEIIHNSTGSEGFSVSQTSDGGYIIGGEDSFPMLYKIDNGGNITWTQTYGLGSGYAKSVKQTSDGGYIISGHYNAAGDDGIYDYVIWLAKTDNLGELTFSKTYQTDTNDPSGDGDSQGGGYSNSVDITSDGGYILFCYSSTNSNSGDTEALLIKTDSGGNEEWRKNHSLGVSEDTQVSGGYAASDGGYVFAGNVGGYPYDGGYIVKTDSNGDIAWSQTGYLGWIESVTETDDGGSILGSSQGGEYWLIKLNSDGSADWDDTYDPGSGTSYSLRSVDQAPDGGYIATGYVYYGGDTSYDITLLKVSSDGIFDWHDEYMESNSKDDFGNSVIAASDGGYILTGLGEAGPGNSIGKLYILKTNNSGALVPCESGQYDCNGDCGGTAIIDECGVCGGNGFPAAYCSCAGQTEDCNGVCGGTAQEDCAGTCGGSAKLGGCDWTCNSTAVFDCSGVCGGSAVISGCDNVCNSTTVDDCAGVCGGSAVLSGCDNACNSTAVVDCAGVCGGSAVLSGCDNACNSTAVVDDCGVCAGGQNDGDVDNDGNVCEPCEYDACGVCNGSGVSAACSCTDTSGLNSDGCCDAVVMGCDNVCGSGLENDCSGVCDGSAVDDACGVCDGSGVSAACSCTDTSGLNSDGCCDAVVMGCDNVCGSGLENDCSSVCGGNNIATYECWDAMDVCGDDASECPEKDTCNRDTACNYDIECDAPGQNCTDNATCYYGYDVYDDNESNMYCYNDVACEYDCDGEPLSLYNGLIPEEYSIHKIYPNPFNPVTNIIYGLPEHINVQIIVYDLSGNQVETLMNQFQTPGYHSVNWNADNHPSGVYFVKIVAGVYINTKKLMLVK